ncbi:MAG: CBS domain-containing protein [Deltaproteobacteria bacterium]|nr:MAG: CBS domain-containing protein [Deltaproteobacteria bacterium]
MKGHARTIMTERVTAVSPDTPLEGVARILVAGRFGGVPVVDRDGQVLGFLSEKDLMTALLQSSNADRPASDIMAREPTVIDEFETTENVMALMRDRQVDHVLVAREGRLVGIITPLDVLRFFVEHVIPPPPEVG